MTANDTCLLCPNPTQPFSCFCLACDGGNVAQDSRTVPQRPMCSECNALEAMPGRKVCEGCAD